MCLTIDTEKTAQLRKNETVVTRYKVVKVYAHQYNRLDVESIHYSYYWQLGHNYANSKYWVELSSEFSEKNVYVGIHVYVNKSDAIAYIDRKIDDWVFGDIKPPYAIMEVKCETSDLIGKGIFYSGDEPIESEAYKRVWVDKLPTVEDIPHEHSCLQRTSS